MLNWPGGEVRTTSQADPQGVPIQFVVSSVARVTDVTFELNGTPVYTVTLNAPHYGQVVRGFALSAAGVPIGDYSFNISARDADGCAGRTGTTRTIRVVP